MHKLALFVLLQTEPAKQVDVWSTILEAGPVVKVVLLLLFAMWLVCLFIVGAKGIRLFMAASASRKFLNTFWEGEDGGGWTTERLETVYAGVKQYANSPVAMVFRAGYVELARVMGAPSSNPGDDVENVERALKRSSNNELTRMENQLPILATIGSTGPFIGLFGTVWGIMTAFMDIVNQNTAGLTAVAQPIAEALIATAIGLVAAIPSVMAYNFFIRRIRVLESEIEAFSNDYLNIVKRHFLRN